jgi:hypothetical protein
MLLTLLKDFLYGISTCRKMEQVVGNGFYRTHRAIPGITSTVTLLVIDEQGGREYLIFTLLVVA